MVTIKNVRVPINSIVMHGLWCEPPLTFHLTFELGVQLCCVTLTMSRKKVSYLATIQKSWIL